MYVMNNHCVHHKEMCCTQIQKAGNFRRIQTFEI